MTTSKAIKICKYKGFDISYKDKIFSAKKGKIITHGSSQESDVRRYIDDLLSKTESEKQELKKQRELEKLQKSFKSTIYKFNAIKFRNFVKKASELNNEVHIEYSKGILKSVMMNPANVAMLQVKIKPLNKPGKNFKTYINVGRLNKIFNKLKSGNIDFKSRDTITLRFKLISKDEKAFQIETPYGSITLPIFEWDRKKEELPDLKYKSHFKINTDEFRQNLRIARSIGESVTLEIKNKKLTLSSGAVSDKHKGEEWKNNLQTRIYGKNCKSKYSLEYLLRKCFTGKKIKVEINSGFPIRITDENGDIFILAPRVESD